MCSKDSFELNKEKEETNLFLLDADRHRIVFDNRAESLDNLGINDWSWRIVTCWRIEMVSKLSVELRPQPMATIARLSFGKGWLPLRRRQIGLANGPVKFNGIFKRINPFNFSSILIQNSDVWSLDYCQRFEEGSTVSEPARIVVVDKAWVAFAACAAVKMNWELRTDTPPTCWLVEGNSPSASWIEWYW